MEKHLNFCRPMQRNPQVEIPEFNPLDSGFRRCGFLDSGPLEKNSNLLVLEFFPNIPEVSIEFQDVLGYY